MAGSREAVTTRERVVKTAQGELVGRMNLRDAALQGVCEWYDGHGDLVAFGIFENGAPYTGTFLNWSKHFSGFGSDAPFDPAVYCQNWVTLFEAGYLSESPKYQTVIEAYSRGKKLEQ
jgi:hypothetical protein